MLTHARFLVVVSLVIEHEQRYLLVRRTQPKPGTWETVSCKVEAGASPAEAAQREALGKTGSAVELLALLDAFHFFSGPSRDGGNRHNPPLSLAQR